MITNEESDPLPAPEDLATEQLLAAVDSAIAGMQERLTNLATDGQDAKWSVSDLVKLIQLRNQLQEERPRRITVRWIDNVSEIGNHNDNNDDDQPEPDIRAVTCIDAHRNKGARK